MILVRALIRPFWMSSWVGFHVSWMSLAMVIRIGTPSITPFCYDLHLTQTDKGLDRLRQSVWQDANAKGAIQRRLVGLVLLVEDTMSL